MRLPKIPIFIKIVLIYASCLLLASIALIVFTDHDNLDESCTMEAMLCPNGSTVGRTGPNCTFAPCPSGENKNRPCENEICPENLPEGYTAEAYTVAERLDTTCTAAEDCQTPFEYLVRSNCPYTTMCLKGACAVICPEHIDLAWEQAERVLSNCEIKKIEQSHNRIVRLFFKDGRNYQTLEPQIDMIFDLARSLKTTCGDIELVTE